MTDISWCFMFPEASSLPFSIIALECFINKPSDLAVLYMSYSGGPSMYITFDTFHGRNTLREMKIIT